MAMGISCVIAPSFGDIFFANCFRNGVLPIVLGEALVERLADSAELTVDLEQQSISASGEVFHFPVDALQREGLLEGLDDIGLTLKGTDEIAAWQSTDRAQRPWVWQTEKVEM
jgi:3-isopropylmalate/(R)-2-methylmalate dehydratase small subunit